MEATAIHANYMHTVLHILCSEYIQLHKNSADPAKMQNWKNLFSIFRTKLVSAKCVQEEVQVFYFAPDQSWDYEILTYAVTGPECFAAGGVII